MLYRIEKYYGTQNKAQIATIMCCTRAQINKIYNENKCSDRVKLKFHALLGNNCALNSLEMVMKKKISKNYKRL